MTTIQERMRRELAERQVFEQAAQAAFDYIENVNDRPVAADARAVDNLQQFDEPLPDKTTPGVDVIQQLHDFGSPATSAQTGGRYFGFVNGNIVPAALAARWLADCWDQNSAMQVMSPVADKLEQICERWLRELLGLPSSTAAGLVTGTSMASLCGFAAARHHLLQRMQWDLVKQGLAGAPPIRIVVSEQAHTSVFRALTLLGFGRQQVEFVPSDDQGRLDVEHLPELDAMTLVIAQAGNVNTGAFDDFETICDRASAASAWVHVDGAFGLWAAGSAQRTHLTKGVGRADSWSLDAHKTLNSPYDCGIVLCRDRVPLLEAMQASAEYLEFSGRHDSMLYTPDMSRRARSIDLWATMKFLGRDGIAEMIDGMCDRAAEFADGLRDAGFNVLNDVVFNQVLFACETPEETTQTLTAVQQSGECWCGASQWRNKPAIRISVCSWSTTSEDVQRSIAAFVDGRDEARKNQE